MMNRFSFSQSINDISNAIKQNKLFVLFGLFLIIATVIFRTFAFSNIVIIGKSMYPTFGNNAVVLVRKFSLENIEVNDIIVANISGMQIVKRVTKIDFDENDNRKFFIVGDNCFGSYDSRDFGFINENMIIGTAIIQIFPFSEIRIL